MWYEREWEQNMSPISLFPFTSKLFQWIFFFFLTCMSSIFLSWFSFSLSSPEPICSIVLYTSYGLSFLFLLWFPLFFCKTSFFYSPFTYSSLSWVLHHLHMHWSAQILFWLSYLYHSSAFLVYHILWLDQPQKVSCAALSFCSLRNLRTVRVRNAAIKC